MIVTAAWNRNPREERPAAMTFIHPTLLGLSSLLPQLAFLDQGLI
jgi:hypothetical protein